MKQGQHQQHQDENKTLQCLSRLRVSLLTGRKIKMQNQDHQLYYQGCYKVVCLER